MEDKIQIGDIVKIKTLSTHSPEMVVDKEVSDGVFLCVWYNSSSGDFRERTLSGLSLVKVPKKP